MHLDNNAKGESDQRVIENNIAVLPKGEEFMFYYYNYYAYSIKLSYWMSFQAHILHT